MIIDAHGHPDFSREFLIEFQDRVLYGRDYLDNAHQELLASLDLPSEILEKIYSGNALKLVPLLDVLGPSHNL